MAKLKKRLSVIFIACAFIFSSSHVFAEELIQEQDNGQNNISSEDASQSTLDSTATSDTNLVVGADTGNNSINDSSVIDNFNSGDISGQTTGVKDYNSSLNIGSQITVKSSEQDNEVDQNDFSNPDASFTIGSGTSDSNNQFLDLNSSDTVDLVFNTGENEFERNTYVESVQTGEINFAANLVNVDNLFNPELLVNLNIYNVLGDFIGDVLVENSFLNQPVPVQIMDDQDRISSNQESISSNAQFDLNTGANVFSNNSLVGDINSGEANGGYFQNDFAGLLTNSNFFIINVLGDWAGQNYLSDYDNIIINNLGATTSDVQILGETEESTSNITQDTTFSAKANTGRNTFKQNTYIGQLSTGDINLMEMIITLKPNLRSLTNKLNIRVLNILGSWRGNLGKAQASCQGDSCNGGGGGSDTPTPTPTDTDTTQPVSSNSGAVLGVSQTAVRPISDVPSQNYVLAATESTFDPSNIQTGTNVHNLLYLLLLIPVLSVLRLRKKA